jgi:hypothetical protein
MNETNASWLTASGTSTINGYSGCTISTGTTLNTNLNGTVGMGNINPSTKLEVTSGLTLSGNSTINYSHSNLIANNMRPTQAKVAVFTITRDSDTNEINSTKFVKELWVEQKNGTSIDLIVAKHLDKDFDPETTVIKVLSTVSF